MIGIDVALDEGIPGRNPVTALRILVLDDEPAICHLVRDSFARYGAEVVCTEEAEEALAMLEYRRFEAFVVDLRLSSPYRLEGLDLIAEARYRSPELRIVVHTGAADEALHADCRRSGADAVVLKSEPIACLRAAVLARPVAEESGRVAS